MSGFKLPGTVWTVLLVGLPLLAAWLETYFPGAIWAAPVAGLLLIVAKVVEVARATGSEAGLPDGLEAEAAPAARGKRSVWWG